MFGFVRPAACRSSAPRSVTDGCPYPPLPRRAKNRNKIQLSSHRKQEISGNDGNSFHRCGGPPPSRREVWGFAGQGLRPCRRLHIGALRSPLSPFARPLEDSYTTPGPGSQPWSFQWGLWGSWRSAFTPSTAHGAVPLPRGGRSGGSPVKAFRPCRRLHIGALRSPL